MASMPGTGNMNHNSNMGNMGQMPAMNQTNMPLQALMFLGQTADEPTTTTTTTTTMSMAPGMHMPGM